MKIAVTFILTATLLTVCGIVSATESSEADTGGTFEEKLAACAACHGENGDQPLAPEYPILAGQYKDYLANSLRQYRDGQRKNQVMALQVDLLKLSDADMDALAAHFASKPSRLRSLAD